MSRKFPAGVATGQMVTDIFQYAKENKFALPAVNVIGSDSINAVLDGFVDGASDSDSGLFCDITTD